MRKLLPLALAGCLLAMTGAAATAAKKKSTAKKSTAHSSAAHKKSAASAKSTTAAKPGTTRTSASKRKKGTARRSAVTWRNRQLAPTAERYKEIQEALSAKGYLPADQATGKWDGASTEAMKKFQADQNLGGSGKINSLSLIALGLGPKRDAAAKAPSAPPGTPAATSP
jgi:hypothetical protein